MTNQRHYHFLVLLLWLCSLLISPALTHAHEDAPPSPSIQTTDSGIEVIWRNPQARSSENAAWQSWPRVAVNGLEIPASLITLRLDRGDDFAIQIEALSFRALSARSHDFAPVELPVRILPTGEEFPPLPRLEGTPTLPDAPVILLRQGQMRGERIGVLAVLPIYQAGGVVREVIDLRFSVEGASLWQTESPRRAEDAWRLADPVPEPSSLTNSAALKLIVTQGGIQEVSIQEVLASGIATRANLAQLQLYHQDQPIALEIVAAEDLIRFYAPAPGDRWNQTSIYWLAHSSGPGLRMTTRPAHTASGETLPQRQSAWERGEWYAPTQYVSQHPGPDGDHWFMADLRAGPDLPTIAITLSAPIGLPPLQTTAAFTLTGTAYLGKEHTLRIHTQGIDSSQQVTSSWSASADWEQPLILSADTQSLVASLASNTPAAVRIDRLTWLRPISLDFNNGGGYFESGDTSARLRLRSLPSAFRLYDITDPHAPVVIASEVGANGELWLDSQSQRRYLLVSLSAAVLYLPTIQGGQSNASLRTPPAGALTPDRLHLRHRPQIEFNPPYDWQTALNTDLLYIAHPLFLDALTPLIAHRIKQGYAVAAVDVESIYAGWSGGYVSPQAIRSFLRYAAAVGSRAPAAVTLIGDGTSDPWDYTGRGNINYMPPYLARVDPWLGETACDVCYAQLDGEDALDDPLPDLMIGRIPAKSAAELDAYIEKLLTYETTGPMLPGSAKALYVADNYRQADGSVDSAGDFAAAAERSIALQPAGLIVERIFYDPSEDHKSASWRIPDGLTARQKTIDAFSAGAGFVTYVGHAHFWQWALTDLNMTPSYLLGLYDVDLLTNRDSPAIVLEMTCLTGAFQTPAFAGTTMDERLLLHEDGGAVAVWGSSGLGVSYGHDALQRGFFTHYWGDPPDKRIGALVEAGQLTLFSQGICCQETLRTFILFGDPAMQPRVAVAQKIHLPSVGQ
ncbi:MAG: hypothetical protein KF893_17520 [Caldilineaceae bacterium]|nr:hypothetical protein [Caldilineaceae bacterium]